MSAAQSAPIDPALEAATQRVVASLGAPPEQSAALLAHVVAGAILAGGEEFGPAFMSALQAEVLAAKGLTSMPDPEPVVDPVTREELAAEQAAVAAAEPLSEEICRLLDGEDAHTVGLALGITIGLVASDMEEWERFLDYVHGIAEGEIEEARRAGAH